MFKKEQLIDTMQRPRSQSLFFEYDYTLEDAIFTMGDEDIEKDGKKLISFKRLFLEIGDPTGYRFAKKYLAGWKHWQKLLKNAKLRAFIEECEDELEVMLRSNAIADLIELSEGEKGSFQASKLLMEKGYSKSKVGRPSKKEKEREQKISAQLHSEFDEDSLRMQ